MKNKNQQGIVHTSQMSSSELCLPRRLLHDRNRAHSSAAIAKSGVNKEITKQRDSGFGKIKQEAIRNRNVFVSFSYGRTGLGLRPNGTVE